MKYGLVIAPLVLAAWAVTTSLEASRSLDASDESQRPDARCAVPADQLTRVRGELLTVHARPAQEEERQAPDGGSREVLRCLASQAEPLSVVRRRARQRLGSSLRGLADCTLLTEPFFERDGGWTTMETFDALAFLTPCYGPGGRWLLWAEARHGSRSLGRASLRLLGASLMVRGL